MKEIIMTGDLGLGLVLGLVGLGICRRSRDRRNGCDRSMEEELQPE